MRRTLFRFGPSSSNFDVLSVRDNDRWDDRPLDTSPSARRSGDEAGSARGDDRAPPLAILLIVPLSYAANSRE